MGMCAFVQKSPLVHLPRMNSKHGCFRGTVDVGVAVWKGAGADTGAGACVVATVGERLVPGASAGACADAGVDAVDGAGVTDACAVVDESAGDRAGVGGRAGKGLCVGAAAGAGAGEGAGVGADED